jgi:hypothetical protein
MCLPTENNITHTTNYRKDPWRLSGPRKQRVRERLRNVDGVIEAVERSGIHCAALERALQLPKEGEMPAKDKYTVFSRTGRDYRKSVHKVITTLPSRNVSDADDTFLFVYLPFFLSLGAEMDQAYTTN